MHEEALTQIDTDLGKLPPAVLESYRSAVPLMQSSFNEEECTIWAKEGLAIGTQTVRSWEAAVEYYRVGPLVTKSLSFPPFMQWARCGTYLSQDSPTLATAFFKASPAIVANLRPQYIPRWAGLGRSLYKGTWKSGTLASKFFEASPGLLQKLPFWDVEIFASLIEALSYKSYDVAIDCLALGKDVLSVMGREREAFLSMARALTETNWREVKPCLELAPRALRQVEESQATRFLKLGERLAKSGLREATTFVQEGSRALGQVPLGSQSHIMDLCESLLAINSEAVPPFLRSVGKVLNRITLNQLDAWFQHGLQLLKDNPESGIAFFKIESNTSERVLETLSSSLELERVKGVITLYCCALSGSGIEVLNTKELVRKGIGWVDEDSASTDGTKVFLPPLVDLYPNKNDNFSWFKVVSTHQVAHLEFGSFHFKFDTPATLFEDRRFVMEQEWAASRNGGLGQAGEGSMTQASSFTNIGRFFQLFDNRQLAFDIFTVLEDCRLDFRLKVEYPGIRRAAGRVQDETLAKRPKIEGLPLQEAMLELLIHMSLEKFADLPVPGDHLDEATMLARILHQLRTANAIVEDTVEATVRAYEIISRLLNEHEPQDRWQPEDMASPEEFSEEDFDSLMEALQEGQGAPGEGEEYDSPEAVEYRGDFKPEMVQLLSKLQADKTQQGENGQNEPISKETLEEILKETTELELDAEQDDPNTSMGKFAQNLMKEAGVPPKSSQPGQGYGPLLYDEDGGGALEAREPRTYAYNEWDFRAGDYRPKWCIIKEKTLEEGDAGFYTDVLKNYASMLANIKRQFELIMPESFRKISRLMDGEDIDLNAALEAWADLKMNVPPEEKIYWRRNKVHRDVAVVFLLDMSASTAEAIDEGRHSVDDRDAPDDPVEYMVWLRRRREGLVRRHYKRIIDLEKESTALLIQALESIGDIYGIYGFSGYGRENVEFYIIKDIEESFSERIKRRIDKITPLHATRMGAAIRHATTKLENQDASTKILFLISDGRPQDRGYSREGVEKEYAVHDTHMALLEARRKEITPFCLTVDKAGHDYLKTMCGDMGYEVLADIWSLPQRLPMLYRKLTI